MGRGSRTRCWRNITVYCCILDNVIIKNMFLLPSESSMLIRFLFFLLGSSSGRKFSSYRTTTADLWSATLGVTKCWLESVLCFGCLWIWNVAGLICTPILNAYQRKLCVSWIHTLTFISGSVSTFGHDFLARHLYQHYNKDFSKELYNIYISEWPWLWWRPMKCPLTRR